MIKKLAAVFLALASLLIFFRGAFAKEADLKVYFFSATGCSHCKAERAFLDTLKEKYPQMEVIEFNILESRENYEILKKVGQDLGIDVSGTPRTFIGEQVIRGYLNDQTTGKQIEDAIKCHLETACPDILAPFLKDSSSKADLSAVSSLKNLTLPLFGKIDLEAVSLPVFTFMIALLDGFNPCAMWTLLFLISLLLGLKNKKRMWLLGGSFIFASAFVYFLFLTAWLNFFLILGFVKWIRVGIGAVALAAGFFNVREFFKSKKGGCSAEESGRRKKILEKLKSIATKENFLLALAGIVLLAAAVNLVELMCSAGLPAIYTQVLSLSNLPLWKYYAYLVFYTLIFMADDLVVFVVAMKTMELVGIESKYARWSRLVGGLLMLVIGALLIFKPEVLMMG